MVRQELEENKITQAELDSNICENPCRGRMISGFQILCLFNSYLNIHKPSEYTLPITGGEKHFLEVAKVWKEHKVRLKILTTYGGYRLCQTQSLNEYCTFLTFDGNRIGVIGAYLLRIVEGAMFTLKHRWEICTYSATDILPDIVPAVVIKLLQGKRSKMACFIFHLIPRFSTRAGSIFLNIISYLSQRVSLSLTRRYSDIIFVDNEKLRMDLISLGFRENNIAVIPLGIDKEKINRAKHIPNLNYDACYVGRLHITKGIFDLIDIWRYVVREKKDASLVIVGGGANEEMMTELRNKLSKYGIDKNIILLGYVPHDNDVYQLMKTSKIFLFPSHEEGWGIALSEAMAAGLPAVVYDLPAFRDKDLGGAITKVKLGDYESFARAILDLLLHEDIRKVKSRKAIIATARYDWEKTAMLELTKLVEITKDIYQ